MLLKDQVHELGEGPLVRQIENSVRLVLIYKAGSIVPFLGREEDKVGSR